MFLSLQFSNNIIYLIAYPFPPSSSTFPSSSWSWYPIPLSHHGLFFSFCVCHKFTYQSLLTNFIEFCSSTKCWIWVCVCVFYHYFFHIPKSSRMLEFRTTAKKKQTLCYKDIKSICSYIYDATLTILNLWFSLYYTCVFNDICDRSQPPLQIKFYHSIFVNKSQCRKTFRYYFSNIRIHVEPNHLSLIFCSTVFSLILCLTTFSLHFCWAIFFYIVTFSTATLNRICKQTGITAAYNNTSVVYTLPAVALP